MVMSRHALHALGQEISTGKVAHIPQTDHADHPFVLVDHRQPADLQRFHVMHRFRQIVVFLAAVDAFGHHVPRHSARGVEALARKTFADEVAIRHHPDQTIVLPDRHTADVVPLHQFRDFGDWSVGAYPIDALVHHVLDFHGGPPFQGSSPPRLQLYNRAGATACVLRLDQGAPTDDPAVMPPRSCALMRPSTALPVKRVNCAGPR